jgi:hypothetical protein
MKYIKTYKIFESHDTKLVDISQSTIDSINDILLDLKDEHSNVKLKCWLEQDDEDNPIDWYFDWSNVDELVSSSSISFEIKPANTFPVPGVYSRKRSYYLSKDEVVDMVETIKRVNDYLKTAKDKNLNIYIHHEGRDRDLNIIAQRRIDINDIDQLLTDFSFEREDGTERNFLYYISMTINTSK